MRNNATSGSDQILVVNDLLVDMLRLVLPNAPAQARRANSVQLSTETRSRRCLQPVCSAISFLNQLFCRLACGKASRIGIYPVNLQPLNLHDEMLRALPAQSNLRLA